MPLLIEGDKESLESGMQRKTFKAKVNRTVDNSLMMMGTYSAPDCAGILPSTIMS